MVEGARSKPTAAWELRVAAKAPIPAELARVIANPQVRCVGAIGGNVANGDPGNDMPAVIMCLGATCHLVGKAGQRRVAAAGFLPGRVFHRLRRS